MRLKENRYESPPPPDQIPAPDGQTPACNGKDTFVALGCCGNINQPGCEPKTAAYLALCPAEELDQTRLLY